MEYPENARYWADVAQFTQNELRKLLDESYQAWAKLVWPDATIEEYSWRDIALQSWAALRAAWNGERDLNQLCVIAWDALTEPTDRGCFPYCK